MQSYNTLKAEREQGISDIKERLRDLETTRDSLQDLLADWDRRLADAGPDQCAGLLESLPPFPSRKERS